MSKARAKVYCLVPLRHEETLPGSLYLFECASRSRGVDVRHYLEIDAETLEVRCSCEHFRFRFARFHPDVDDEGHHCAHAALTIALMRIHRVLDTRPLSCRRCGAPNAPLRLVDDFGEPIPGRICVACISGRAKPYVENFYGNQY